MRGSPTVIPMALDCMARARSVLDQNPLTRAEALEMLAAPPEQLPELIAGASLLRRAAFGMTVKVNYLVNLRSGLCPEDCGYCSQRLGSAAEVLNYSWLDVDEAARLAAAGVDGGARRVCLVASGRGPSRRDVQRVADMTTAIKERDPQIEVCACLGFLKDEQAEVLRDAGVDAYNHNLNTSRAQYESICTTHTYDDREDTVRRARDAGLSPCSGLIVGMGESDEDIVDTLTDLVALDVDSIPVNFLMPFAGTPMEGRWDLTPQRCLQILAVARFLAPRTEIRLAGGREMHLRSQQPTALMLANSLFLGDYLTGAGQAARADLEMLRDGGFTLALDGSPTDYETLLRRHAEAQEAAPAEGETGACCGGHDGGGCGGAAPAAETEAAPEVVARWRGAGTAVAPNA